VSEVPVGRPGVTRDLNHRAVLERLADVGPASRAELARELAISPASVSRVVDTLLRGGLVREGDRVANGIGRPQTLLHVNAEAGLVVGASIRSVSLRMHLADLDGTVIAQTRVPRRQEGPRALAEQLRDVVLELAHAHAPGRPIAAVVIGLSAVWDELGKQVYAAPNLSLLEGVDARELFCDALSGHVLGRAVMIDNDINFAALGEEAAGAAHGVGDFFYLSLGSGVGGAAVVNGRIQRGRHGFAGEVGYLPVVADGQHATLEDVVGRRALERLAERKGLLRENQDVFQHLEDIGGVDDVVGRHVSEVVAQALASIVTTLDPQLIVLGGGVGRYSDAWTSRIRERLQAYLPVVPDVVSTAIGREASLLGAVAAGRAMARDALLSRELGP